EILEYRFQQELLERLAAVADRLPQVVRVGDGRAVDFLEIARQMIGAEAEPLYTPEDLQAIRARLEEIRARIRERGEEIDRLVTAERAATTEPAQAEEANAERVEEIRRSVTDEAVKERVERIGEHGEGGAR
ncbi:MAG: SPFH domain-containing protein, partial [Actinomycetota bacterium]